MGWPTMSPMAKMFGEKGHEGNDVERNVGDYFGHIELR
jgi:hypothetical protein